MIAAADVQDPDRDVAMVPWETPAGKQVNLGELGVGGRIGTLVFLLQPLDCGPTKPCLLYTSPSPRD